MDTRVAVIAIIVEKKDSVLKLNSILNDYSDYIIGRMGIPYKPKEINVISIVVDAPQDIISAMSGKIGRLEGISTKTAYSNVTGKWKNLLINCSGKASCPGMNLLHLSADAPMNSPSTHMLRQRMYAARITATKYMCVDLSSLQTTAKMTVCIAV